MQIIEMNKIHYSDVTTIFKDTLNTSIPAKIGQRFIREVLLPFCNKDYNTKVFLQNNGSVNGFIIITSSDRFFISMIKSKAILFMYLLVLKLIRDPKFIMDIFKIVRVIKKTNEFEDLDKRSELLYLAVKDSKQNLNIGNELFNYSIKYLKNCGDVNLLIQTLLDDDGIKARKFYEKNSCTILSTYENRVWYIRCLK